MNCTVFQRQSARRDILEIIDRISDDNPAAAGTVFEGKRSKTPGEGDFLLAAARLGLIQAGCGSAA